MTGDSKGDLVPSRYVIALDMDYFYCQVELRKRPDVNKNLPVGAFQRNLVVTCNYPARAAGVKKLMLVQDAYKVCHDLILFDASDLKDYRIACSEIICLLKEKLGGIPVENLGLDEFFIDVSEIIRNRTEKISPESRVIGYCWPLEQRDALICLENDETRDFVVASQLCREIREEIRSKLHLTCSGGISNSKMLSKLAASLHKPDEQTIVFPHRAESFLSKLSLRKLPGIGSITYQNLIDHFSVSTCEQLRCISVEKLSERFGSRLGVRLFNMCRGIDEEEVHDTSMVKSISCEERLTKVNGWSDVERYLLIVLERLLDRIVEHATIYPGRYARSLFVAYLKSSGSKREIISSSVPFDLIRLCKMCNTLRTWSSEHSIRFSDLRRLALEQLCNCCRNLLQSRLGIYASLCLISVGVKNFITVKEEDQCLATNSIVSMFRRKVDSNHSTVSSVPVKCCICDAFLGIDTSNEDINRHIDKCLGMKNSEHISRSHGLDAFIRSKKPKHAFSSHS